MTRRFVWGAVCAAAVGCAIAPMPSDLVERWYSRGLYPPLQRALTSASNLVPFALFDVLWMSAVAAAALLAYRCIRSRGWRRGTIALVARLLAAAAALYLVFLAAWGFNYRRVALVDKLAFDPARITRRAATQLGEINAAALNRRYAAAHREPAPLEAIAAHVEAALRAIGSPAPFVPARPKPTLLGGYFHEVSVAGMTDPFLLETLVAPDLLDVERPFVIAHEWAHLAGYADESEANFVAWLACRRGSPAEQYSAALMLIGYASPPGALKDALDIGPRTDLYAIQRRYAHTNATLRFAARQGYDTYLKANRVERGVESYDAVIQLILGTEFDAAGNPRVR